MRVRLDERLILVVIALAVGIGSYAVIRIDPWAGGGSGLAEGFRLDVGNLLAIDPELVQFAQTDEFTLPLNEVRAVAMGPDQRIYVAGDRSVYVLEANGKKHAVLPIEGTPGCLAIAGADHTEPGRVYIGAGPRVEVFDASAKPVGGWEGLGAGVIVTSIGVAENDIFVADAGNRVVMRFDPAGRLLGRIGAANADGEVAGFIVPSRYFDVAVGGDQLLHVASPGAQRIESFTFDGDLQAMWGRPGSSIGDFFGCCNPVHFALLPSGQVVTSEKGIPRIKLYSEQGEFQCVVAGPQQLGVAEHEIGDPRSDQGQLVFDVATDAEGRVLVLDPRSRSVRVFSRTPAAQGAEA